jgi:antitoxin ParD1/3/4
MKSARKRAVPLPEEEADYVDSLVAAGTYATDSEVVRAGLDALRAQEAEIEDWLREEVLPVVEAMEADPSRGIPIDEVFDAIRARHREQVKDGAK